MEAPRATPYGTDSSLRETRRSIASKLLLRVIRHLTRRTALLAIILSCLAALIGVLVGPSTAVGQVMLVAMGIFVSVVVLPEVPYRLWNVKPIDLAETVPSDQLLHASRVLAKAIDIQSRRAPHNSMLPENLITNVWNEALQMLLEIVDDPSKVLCNLEYTARITPATDSNALQRVDTTIRAERHLPRAKGGPVWFSYCSCHLPTEIFPSIKIIRIVQAYALLELPAKQYSPLARVQSSRGRESIEASPQSRAGGLVLVAFRSSHHPTF